MLVTNFSDGTFTIDGVTMDGCPLTIRGKYPASVAIPRPTEEEVLDWQRLFGELDETAVLHTKQLVSKYKPKEVNNGNH